MPKKGKGTSSFSTSERGKREAALSEDPQQWKTEKNATTKHGLSLTFLRARA